jgi:hypothetical protein
VSIYLHTDSPDRTNPTSLLGFRSSRGVVVPKRPDDRSADATTHYDLVNIPVDSRQNKGIMSSILFPPCPRVRFKVHWLSLSLFPSRVLSSKSRRLYSPHGKYASMNMRLHKARYCLKRQQQNRKTQQCRMRRSMFNGALRNVSTNMFPQSTPVESHIQSHATNKD